MLEAGKQVWLRDLSPSLALPLSASDLGQVSAPPMLLVSLHVNEQLRLSSPFFSDEFLEECKSSAADCSLSFSLSLCAPAPQLPL